MTLYLLVREYDQDRTTILGVYSSLELAQSVIKGLEWEEIEGEPVPSWGAEPYDGPKGESVFIIYELVLDNVVDIY
jgi:hypothetical protein